MSCGYIAMQLAGVEVESYDAYEIDKYAIQAATHNFPMIKEHGDVFNADFTQYEGVNFLCGGSPCTHWSIAQTKDRETSVNRDEKGNILLHSSGIGFELFSQYLRALEEAKPQFFIYENNKSMSKDIRAAITECFGFEPICINSALVSAQNRQRLYWVGKRNADGTYSKVNVQQPEDRGILLKDVLDSAVARDLICNDKSYTLTASYGGACAWNTIERHQRNVVAEPVMVQTPRGYNDGGSKYKKAPTLTAASYEHNNRIVEPAANYIIEHDDNGKPIKAIRDGKETPIYEVRGGKITIKGKQYPIKLKDGYYIIRKLTVSECKRLQTVPEWYDFSVVSNSQAYKMLGNGWTCEVIAHLIKACLEPTEHTESTECGEQFCLF